MADVPPSRNHGSEPEPTGADEAGVELSIGHYFGGYAVIFLGVIGFALTLVLLLKWLR